MAYTVIGGTVVPTSTKGTGIQNYVKGTTGTQVGGTYVPKAKVTSPLNKVVNQIPETVYIEAGGETGGTAPGYNFPDYNIPIPDLSWQPTEAQRNDWLAQAIKRAGLLIDPQVASRNEGYNRFSNEAEAQRAEINPRMTAMSLALANVFKNVVQGNLVNNAIRRGATESGWLPEQQANIGREEVAQRTGIENQRNTLLDAITKQVLAKRQETDDALQQLETMRGAQTDVSAQDIENQARQNFYTEKQGTFENMLNNAIFQSGYDVNKANYGLNQFNAQTAAGLGEGELALKNKQFGLDQIIANYNMNQPKSYSKVNDAIYTINIPGVGEFPATRSEVLSWYKPTTSAEEKSFLEKLLTGQV